MQASVDNVVIECLRGDLTQQPDIGAIVNAANAQLAGGGGVDGAINRAAGPELVKASRKLAPISPGQAVITDAFELPNDYVIHCLGPVYGRDTPSDKLLADCYRNALQLAEERGLTSIAFPAISSGAFGYPVEEAAEVAMQTVVKAAPELQNATRVRFCLFSETDERVYAQQLSALTDG